MKSLELLIDISAPMSISMISSPFEIEKSKNPRTEPDFEFNRILSVNCLLFVCFNYLQNTLYLQGYYCTCG